MDRTGRKGKEKGWKREKKQKRSSCKREGWKKERSKQAEKKANKDTQRSASKTNTRSKSTGRCNSQEVGQQLSSTDELLTSEDPGATLDSIEPLPDGLTEDANQCCVCFEMYEADSEWVQCVCKQWLHEDCYTEVVVDKYGRELLCPFCVV